MCGIAAQFSYRSDARPVDRDELLRVRDHMAHRGPDGEGIWISDDQRVGLAHRRLSIIDLSEAGAQPMWNADRTLCITFNGEIYNYAALRGQLIARGYRFNSHCDTEVILQLYADKGAAMLNDLRGMYAFAIWDAQRRELFMARDPFGIKPLYYADDGKTIRVASQVRALLAGGGIRTSVDPAGPVGFFVWGAVPDPFTMYREIVALPAGHHLTVHEDGGAKLESFCSIPEILREAEEQSHSRNFTDAESHELLHAALRDSAEHHLVADVPVGVFLSAGLDSSTLTALVSESHNDVRTVTLGFEEYRGSEMDETPLAEVVARQCGTNHQTIAIARQDFEREAAAIFQAMDRPSIDGVNTYFVSLAAKRAGLKVALSGLGGDELFGGYPSFNDVPRMVRWFGGSGNLLPAFGREFRVISAPLLKRLTSPKYAGIFEYGSSYPGAYLLRRSLFMPWELPSLLDPELVREGWQRLNTLSALGAIVDRLREPRTKVSALEMCWYMRHQLLRDSDWAGMGHSLEIRVPLVDVELLKRIAPLLVSATPPTKHDMAVSPEKPLPASVLQRPKTGFGVPVRDWLLQSFDPTPGRERGLRGWAREVYSRFADTTAMHGLKMTRKKGKSRTRRGTPPGRRSGPRGSGFGGGAEESKAKVENGFGGAAAHSHLSTSYFPRSTSLRALVLVTDAFGSLGGIAKFNRDFLAALCADERISEVITVPRLMPQAPGPLPPKLRMITDALGGKVRFVTAVQRVARELRSRRDGSPLLIFCGHINLLPVAAVAKQICGGTLHLIVHGIDAWKPFHDPLVRTALHGVDGFIAVSRVTQQRFQHWTGFRFDDGIVLPNCVDLDQFTPGPKSPELLDKYGLAGRRVLMTFGRLESAERYKGFDEVIEQLPRLSRSFPNIAYLVCGDGPDRQRLIEKCRRLGCEVRDCSGSAKGEIRNEKVENSPRQIGRAAAPSTSDFPLSNSDADSQLSTSAFPLSNLPLVVFTGRVAEEEKVAHYRLADLYVMPSYGEGFGIVFLEALACGVPVIGSKADGSREALREGLLGTLVDPRDADETFAAISDALARNGQITIDREAVEFFSTGRYRDRVHEIIDAIAPAH